MNMKTNYLKLNSWAVAALMGMCSLAACSDDNSGEHSLYVFPKQMRLFY